jgi:CspA family cold shock protein
MTLSTLIQTFKRLLCRKKARQHGIIKFYDRKKRFGFITTDNQEYFFHASSTRSENIKGLRDGKTVSFVLVKGKKGLQADQVELLKS